MQLDVSGEIIHWRGPSPFHFVVVPADESDAIDSVKADLTYGWGAIPVRVTLGQTEFRTSLFPKDGHYLVPIKDAVRRSERVDLGDSIRLRLHFDL